ncbi:saccharopine dehydrogenase NADP-binding domain-containing protein [Actinoplanes sp. NPDC051470]|uniref:saccharopine dehydrogenase family protein n=1 Tax=Actinoplanes sp. NPDC051470 TaxID=3157224 RepID=UPI00343B543F
MTDHERDHDLVVYGATGFVGALVAAYLADHGPDGVRIALGGRSREKLEQLRGRLGVDWPLIVAAADDEIAMAKLAASAQVVATTVGPYLKHGRTLVRACAAAGTDYVDLTGEVAFHRQSIDDNEEMSRSTGARIVHSCGFDSIPSDLGVHVLHQLVRGDDAGQLTDTTLVVTSLRGGFSGGTIDSMRTQVDVLRADRDLRRVAASAYSLSPDRKAEPELGRQEDAVSMPGRAVDRSLSGHVGPFMMASYNSRVVRRSNALRGWAYGRSFRYREAQSTGTSPAAPVIAAGLKVGLGALLAGLSLPPTRFVLDRVLPKPGSGPDEKTRRNGHFTMDIFTTTTTGARYRSRFRAKGDPGYAATAVMLGESALALVLDRDKLPPSDGGVLTPATALGDVLVDRLRATGVEISAKKLA